MQGVQGEPTGSRAGELKEIIAAERAGVPFLYWRSAQGELAILRLDPSRWRVTIGRAGHADIALTGDAQISRTHATLERVGEDWTLVDDGLSRNGSYVNAERVIARRRLFDRDRLCFGDTEVVYRTAAVQTAIPTASVGDDPAAFALSPMQRRVLIALCRPLREQESAMPATNRQIADEVFLSVDAVKAHLRVLFERFELGDLPQNEKRARLAALVLVSGLLSPREF
jgi:hypothetical protein